MLDDHSGGVRNINADFDNGGGDKNIDEVLAKTLHDVLACIASHAAMNQADAKVLKPVLLQFFLNPRGGAKLQFRFINGRHYDIRLFAFLEPWREPFVDVFTITGGRRFGEDGLAARRKLIDDRHIKVTEGSHRK